MEVRSRRNLPIARNIDLFTPSERTRRIVRLGAAIGKCLGFGLLAAPVSLIASLCAVREAWHGVDYEPDPDQFVSPLFKHGADMARLQREKRLKRETDD